MQIKRQIPKCEPMALRQKDAASYCGVSIPTFLKLVEEGTLPAGRYLGQTTKIWIRLELDESLMELPSDLSETTETGFEALHEWTRA